MNGFEGMLRESAHFLSQLVTMFAAAGILFYLNPILELIMCLLAVGRGLLHNQMARYEKEEFQDKNIPLWRQEYYYSRTTSNFEYARTSVFLICREQSVRSSRGFGMSYIKICANC